MSRSLASIIVLLAPLALLGACLEVAPRSSLAFQGPAEREARYAAEVALAIKEDRRDAVSEAAVNGRQVLPQMPEIWAVAPSQGPLAAGRAQEVALAPGTPDLGAVAGLVLPPAGCAGPENQRRDREVCPSDLPGAGRALPVLSPAAIAPASGPLDGSGGWDWAVHRYRLYFERDSVDLDLLARRILESAVGGALLLRPSRIVVAGPAGIDSDHQSLSSRRAATVVDALIRAGLPADRIETTTQGAAAPPLRTDGGGANLANRRIEIALL